MAYSNWGGTVFRNGEPLPEQCDASPYRLIGAPDPERYGSSYHAIVGASYHAIVGDVASGDVVALLYKSYVSGVGRFIDGQFHPLSEEELETWMEAHAHESADGDHVWVNFTDAQGNAWEGESGYEFGNGFDEWC